MLILCGAIISLIACIGMLWDARTKLSDVAQIIDGNDFESICETYEAKP